MESKQWTTTAGFVFFLSCFSAIHLLGREGDLCCRVRALVLGSDLHTGEEEPEVEQGQHPWTQTSGVLAEEATDAPVSMTQASTFHKLDQQDAGSERTSRIWEWNQIRSTNTALGPSAQLLFAPHSCPEGKSRLLERRCSTLAANESQVSPAVKVQEPKPLLKSSDADVSSQDPARAADVENLQKGHQKQAAAAPGELFPAAPAGWGQDPETSLTVTDALRGRAEAPWLNATGSADVLMKLQGLCRQQGAAEGSPWMTRMIWNKRVTAAL